MSFTDKNIILCTGYNLKKLYFALDQKPIGGADSGAIKTGFSDYFFAST
jgi:hypothetical protein